MQVTFTVECMPVLRQDEYLLGGCCATVPFRFQGGCRRLLLNPKPYTLNPKGLIGGPGRGLLGLMRFTS